MTASKHVLLWCDGTADDGGICTDTFDSGETRVPDARSDARYLGWTYGLVRGKDLCPVHSAKARRR